MFTLFDLAAPEELGIHQFQDPGLLGESTEKSRGIIYTQKAGFLDLAHVRLAIDWSHYFQEQVQQAMLNFDTHITLSGMDATRYHLKFNYPAQWRAVTPIQKAALINELSLRTGQRLAYTVLTWHEIITWFGYRSTVVIPEGPSAFTYDDMISHVIGLRVAETAARLPSHLTWDQAVTKALDEELRYLGAQSPEETMTAIESVEGVWWHDGAVLRRQIETGLDVGSLRPWLIEDAGRGQITASTTLAIPSMDQIGGMDFGDLVEIELESDITEYDDILSVLPTKMTRVKPDRDFVMIVDKIRDEMIDSFGADVGHP